MKNYTLVPEGGFFTKRKPLVAAGNSWLILLHQSENKGQDLALPPDWRNI